MISIEHGRVANKKVVLTGAGGVLGRAIAKMLGGQGARLFLTDIDGKAAMDAACLVNGTVGSQRAYSAQHDVRDASQWERVFEDAVATIGGVSVLVNNAGVGSAGEISEITLDDWRRTMAVNLDGVFLGCRSSIHHLASNQPASIINISSVASYNASPDYAAYGSAKAAVSMLTKILALDCARKRLDIRCNSVHPNYIRTSMTEPYFDAYGESGALRRLTRDIPLRRLGEPDDVAFAVLYLASDESRFVTASEIRVDGGVSAKF